MAIGTLQTEADLDRWMRSRYGRVLGPGAGGAGGSGVAANVPYFVAMYSGDNQYALNNEYTELVFDELLIDTTDGAYSTADNQFKPSEPGVWFLTASLNWNSNKPNAAGDFIRCLIYKNGPTSTSDSGSGADHLGTAIGGGTPGEQSGIMSGANTVMSFNGSTDYSKVGCFQNCGQSRSLGTGLSEIRWVRFEGFRLSDQPATVNAEAIAKWEARRDKAEEAKDAIEQRNPALMKEED